MPWECALQVPMQARYVRCGSSVTDISELTDLGVGTELLDHLLEQHKLLTLSHLSRPSASYQSLI